LPIGPRRARCTIVDVKLLAVALVLVLAVRTAGAQPGMVDPDPPPPPQRSQVPLPEELSESTAFWLSLGGTVGSYGLWIGAAALATSSNSRIAGTLGSAGVVGTVIAPGFGHWYAGKYFTRGLGLRLGGVGVAFIGLLVAIGGCPLFDGGHGDETDSDCGNPGPGAALALLGAGMWVGGTVDDIIQAPRRVNRINAARNEASYALTPLLRHDSAGLALVGAF